MNKRDFLSDHDRIQTYNLRIRSAMLYSVELRSHCVIASAKIPYFGKFSNPVSDFFDIFWLLKLKG
jgi:hypothetical protein